MGFSKCQTHVWKQSQVIVLCSHITLFSSGTCLLHETWKCVPGSTHPGHYYLLIAATQQITLQPWPRTSALHRDGTYSCHTNHITAVWPHLHNNSILDSGLLATADPGSSQTPHTSGHTCHYKRNTRLRQSAPGSNMPIKPRLWPFVCICAVFSVLDTQLCSACWSTVTTVTSMNSSMSVVISVPCLRILTSGLVEQPQDTNRLQEKAVCAVRGLHTLNSPFCRTLWMKLWPTHTVRPHSYWLLTLQPLCSSVSRSVLHPKSPAKSKRFILWVRQSHPAGRETSASQLLPVSEKCSKKDLWATALFCSLLPCCLALPAIPKTTNHS